MQSASTKKARRRFRSINAKMSLILGAILFGCVTGIVGFFLVGNLERSVHAEQQRLMSLGSIYRSVLSEPVQSRNKAATRDVLRSLRDISTLRYAAVHDAGGVLLGEMGRGAILERKVLNAEKFSVLDVMNKESVRIESDIVNGGKVVGSMRLIADISWLIRQFWVQVGFALMATIGAIVIAWIFGSLLIRRASRRLSALASGLADIGTSENLDYKFTRETNDEVGILVDAFNDMMGRINDRDRALRHYNENLENTVSERTKELLIARDEAQSANAAKSEFLAMMSHEIRTPMNGMMVMAQMLAAAPLSPRHLRFAEIINRSGQNLLSIINDVLDISKIEAGKLTIETAPFSIDDMLADIHGLFYERAREKQIEISYKVAPSVPDILIGDPTRLNQVITNLVNNALKFTEKGGVSIGVKTSQTASGMKLHVDVTDTGIGIAADKLALVFERFAQADQTISRRFGGTGLGLAISRRLVEAMGGEISVSSREGEGSNFAFDVAVDTEQAAAPAASFVNKKIKVVMRNRFQQNTLVKILAAHGAQVATDPKDKSSNIVLSDDLEIIDASLTTALFVEPAIDAMDAGYKNRGRLSFSIPTSRKQVRQLALALEMQDFTGFRAANRSLDRAQSFIEFRGLRALAVDDNTVNREVLVEALSSMGIEADTAINGEDALVKAKAQDYDVIFMDCSMPVMDGYTATRILRDGEKGTGKRIPIVAITALTERRGKDDWRHAGMDGWISKPFTIPSVAERITTLVLKHEATHLNASEMSDEEKLIAKFEVLPLLDEQTVSMIARLGSKGDSPAVRKIHDLFVTQSTQAIEKLNASNEDDLEEMATLAHMLQSVSLSIGAARVSRMAAHVEDDAKAGKAVPQSFLREMKNCQDLSAQAIAARFGVVNTKPRTTALKSA